jgi:hypothetical protein
VAFLYISDDMEWGRKNVKNNHNDLHFVGTGNGDIDEDVAYDFALLAYSNHSIPTQGSFGLWASIICGGDVYTKFGPVPGPIYIKMNTGM